MRPSLSRPYLAVAAAVGLSLAACTPHPPTPPDAQPAAGAGKRAYGSLTFRPCTLAGTLSADNLEAQCTTLAVPEDPAKPAGRKVALNIAWLPATQEGGAAADPVFFLAGGPGQSAVETFPQIDAAFAEVRKQRHVILVDQRGTGRSNALSCRDDAGKNAYAEGSGTGEAALATATAAVGRCAASLAATADPRFYTTTDAVRDLDTVRAALGVAQVDLVGVSYGTRVAQQYAMRHPAQVRSLVLDGVVPNELVLGAEMAKTLDDALGLQFARCQKEAACRDRLGGDTRALLRRLMARLDAAPANARYRDPATNEDREGTLHSGDVAGLVRMFAYVPQAASLLPLVLNEADQGRYAPIMGLSQILQGQMEDQFMYGMQLSVLCAEDVDLLQDNPADAGTVLGEDFARTLRAQCTAWPKGTRPADFHAPLVGKTPTLLMSGEFDPVTPPRYGAQVASHLSNARHFVLAGQGHNVLPIGCMPKLLGKFLETADPKSLDGKCLASVGYVPPFTSFNGWEP